MAQAVGPHLRPESPLHVAADVLCCFLRAAKVLALSGNWMGMMAVQSRLALKTGSVKSSWQDKLRRTMRHHVSNSLVGCVIAQFVGNTDILTSRSLFGGRELAEGALEQCQQLIGTHVVCQAKNLTLQEPMVDL